MSEDIKTTTDVESKPDVETSTPTVSDTPVLDEAAVTAEEVSSETDETNEESPKNPLITDYVDLTRANVRFEFIGDLRPKHPKTSSREKLDLPLYSPRVQLAAMEAYLTNNFEAALERKLLDEPLTPEQNAVYNATIAETFHPRADVFDKSLMRPGSSWTNSPVSPNGVSYLTPGIPKADDLPDDDKTPLSGEMAVYYAIRATKSGSPATMPLWHSGIWLNQNPPTNDRVALMHERIAAEKISGGRFTAGYMFAATSIISNKHAIEMALECCYSANVANSSIQQLMDIIPVTDQPAIMLNTLLSMYPYGYPYIQSCLANPDTCHYTVSDVVSINKFWQADNSAITSKMRTMMYEAEVMTKERLAEYKAELGTQGSRQLALTDDGAVVVELAVPSISRNIQYGERWLRDLNDGLKDVLSRRNLSFDDRERIVQEHQFYSWMRQYEAWVKSVHIRVGDSMRAVAEADIPKVLTQWSRDDDLRERYIEGVTQFISDSTIALAAMPVWTCPDCQADIPPEIRDRKYYDLVPLDVAHLFFTLNSVQQMQGNQVAVI